MPDSYIGFKGFIPSLISFISVAVRIGASEMIRQLEYGQLRAAPLDCSRVVAISFSQKFSIATKENLSRNTHLPWVWAEQKQSSFSLIFTLALLGFFGKQATVFGMSHCRSF